MSFRRSRSRRRRGQAMVELAIVAPILVLLVTGGAQVAVVVYSQVSVGTASREGARTAVDNPKDTQLFPAAVTKDCTSSSDTRKACAAAFNSTTQTFGLVNPANFTVHLSSQKYPSGTSTPSCNGSAGTADDGLVQVQVTYQAPIFVPFVNRFFADSGQSYRTVKSTVTMRVSPCSANGGN
ncbi:MAG: pilus assembly protein [Chloroflexi bacterium]|nr:MAG: pilus assembly protein [Chloroflexota bacterium]